MKNFFHKFLDNLKKIFILPNTFWHILTIAITYLSLTSGFDWYYFSVTRSIDANWIWIPAGMLGSLLPLLAPLILYAVGRIKKNLQVLNTAYALGQAAILASLVSSTYKAFTGRIPPDLNNALIDISHGFRFGFLEGGIFWGWPSSHATIAFAMVLTLIILYSQNSKIKYFGLIYAIYIAFGASIGFHWFSEVISGIIIGSVIGTVVGKSFKHRFIAENAK